MDRKSFSANDYLMHHGIKGMKWGVRRYRNEDGTLTEEGKQRYGTVERLEQSQQRKKAAVKAVATSAAYGAWAYFWLSGKGSKVLDKASGAIYKQMLKRGKSKVSSMKLSDMTMDDLSKLDLY